MFSALKDAEAWFSGTIPLLKERLTLCEDTRNALKEMNTLLAKIEALRGRKVVDRDDRTRTLEKESVGRAMVSDRSSSGEGTANCDLPQKFDTKRLNADNVGIEVKDSSADGDHNNGQGLDTKDTRENLDNQLKAMELAVEDWLREVRVLRAKWIAGGKNVDRLTGLRW